MNYNEDYIGTIHNLNRTIKSIEDWEETLDKKVNELDTLIAKYKEVGGFKLLEQLKELKEVFEKLINDREKLKQITINVREEELDKDYDNDGLRNRDELLRGSNAYEKDSDKDGIEDNREM